MEQESAFVGKCSQMKESLSERSTDDDSVVSNEGNVDWHYDTCSHHYWKQYSYIFSWIGNYRKKFSEWCQLMHSYHAAMASYMQGNYITAIPPQQLVYDWYCAPFSQNVMQSRQPISASSFEFHKKYSRGRKRRRRRSRAKKQGCHSSAADVELHIANIDPDGGGLDVQFGDGNENLEFEFEITDDLVEFFAETARHRKERDLMKMSQLTEAKNNETTNADLCSEVGVRVQPTVLPPSEQLGARRLTEMRELYGAGAAMIHGMETAMQLSFDRNTDRHKPRPWPALPLNIQFD